MTVLQGFTPASHGITERCQAIPGRSWVRRNEPRLARGHTPNAKAHRLERGACPAGVQLSEAVRLARKLGTAALQPASAATVAAAGQVTIGGVLSTTLNVLVQELTLPAASATVTTIKYVPGPAKVPAAGF